MPPKIANLDEIKILYPQIKIRAYVDLSTDQTLELLRQRSDIIEVYAATETTGKAIGMCKLVAESNTEVIIFTDANVIVDPKSIGDLLRYFTDPEIGGVSGTLIYTNSSESMTANVNSMYWRIEEAIKKADHDVDPSWERMDLSLQRVVNTIRLFPHIFSMILLCP